MVIKDKKRHKKNNHMSQSFERLLHNFQQSPTINFQPYPFHGNYG